VAFNTGYVEDSLAVQIAKTPPLVSDVQPAAGTLEGGTSQDVTVTINTADRSDGTYEGGLPLSTNDPGADVVEQPLAVTVDGPPGSPTGVQATAGSDSVSLGWTAPAEPDIARYRIYRDTTGIDTSTAPSDIAAYDSVTVGTPRYVDADVDLGTEYHYRVTTVDEGGKESDFSGEAAATPLRPPAVALRPSSLSATLRSTDPSTQALELENAATGDVRDLRFSVDVEPRTSGQDPQSSDIHSGDTYHRGTSPSSAPTRSTPYERFAQTASKSETSGPRPNEEDQLSQASSSPGLLFGLSPSDLVAELDPSDGSVHQSFASPASVSGGPDATTLDGTDLYFYNQYGTKTFYRFDATDGTIRDSVSATAISGISSPQIDALGHDGTSLYALDFGSSTIYEIDLESRSVVGTITPGVPLIGGLTFAGRRGTFFVSNFDSDVYEIDPETGEVVNRWTPPTAVLGLGYSEARGTLFATGGSEMVYELDPETGSEVSTFTTTPVFTALTGDGTGAGTGWLTVSPASGTVSPNSTRDLSATFDPTGLRDSTYEATIRVSHNDPDRDTLTVPVTLTVTGPPEPPTALAATAGPDTVALDWTASEAHDVARYRIYRDTTALDSTAGPSGLTPYDSVAAGTRHYADTDVQIATQYHYRVTAVDDSSYESTFSGETTATPRHPPVLSVQPDSVTAETAPGTQIDRTLTITNDGLSDSRLQFSFPGFAAEQLLQQVPASQHNDPERRYGHRDLKKGATDPRTGSPVTLGAGGPDGFGYRWIDSNEPSGPAFQWTDIRSEGTQADLFDDGSVTVDLPSSVSFYGTARSEVTISANGYLTFGAEGGDYSNDEIPDAARPNALIAPFWDDLNPSDAGTVHYLRDAAAERLIVQWTGVTYFSGDGTNTFQVVLEGDGTIRYRYLEMSPRESATVGIENGDGSDGLQVAFNTGYVEDSLAVQIAKTPPLVSDVQPASGTLEGGTSQDVTVTINTTNRDEGRYETTLPLVTNDPGQDTTDVPVAVTVDRLPTPADLTVRPDSPRVMLSWNAVEDEDLRGYNVYRARTPFGTTTQAEKLNDAPMQGTTYADASVADSTSYFYRVKAANDNGGTSLASNQVLGELPVASASRLVQRDSTYAFGETGTTVGFAGTSGSDTVHVRKFSTPPVRTDSIDEQNVSSYRFRIAVDDGLTVGDMTLRLDVSTLRGVGDADNVALYGRRSLSDAFAGLTTLHDGASGVLIAATDAPGDLALASNTEPLPVELTQFEGRAADGQVVLRWRTASEQNNAGFRIQRRTMKPESGGPGSGWQDVGRVQGAGTTSEAQSYRFEDSDLPYAADSLTYRLAQVDADGSTQASPTVTVVRESVENIELLGTYPNPARQQATVRYALPGQQEVSLRVYDVLGRRVHTVVQSRQKGRHKMHLDVSNLASGVYFLRMRSKGKTRTQKLTIVR
jgi:fibronectin type 3 domain-containing protein